MSPRILLIVILALVLGPSAVDRVNIMRNQEPPPPPPKPETVPVLVVALDIPEFGVITPELVKSYDCPKDLVPLGALTRVEEALDRAALTPLVRGEILRNARLAPRGAGRGMTPLVKPAMR